MRRREFIAGLAGAAFMPVMAQAQQPALPIIGFINRASLDTSLRNVVGFRAGLAEQGFVEDRKVVIEYHWPEGQFDRSQALVADLVRRRVAVIATSDVHTLDQQRCFAPIPISRSPAARR